MANKTQWSGTATDLLADLDATIGERASKAKGWPKNAQTLTGRLHRAATFLRKLDIAMTFKRETHAGTRTITITTGPQAADLGTASAATPVATPANSYDLDDDIPLNPDDDDPGEPLNPDDDIPF
jgi:hypothetical protein